MLNLILAEAALETVPKQLWSHPSVLAQARVRKRHPGQILLDRSYHHSGMTKLSNAHRRGRPDLVHHSILAITSSPLYMSKKVKIFIHTVSDKILSFSSDVRPPKSYFRFEGLMSKIFRDRVSTELGEPLIRLRNGSFEDLIDHVRPSHTTGLSTSGDRSNVENVVSKLLAERNPAIVVGAFPRGQFSKSVRSSLDSIYSIHRMPLEAHVVIARIIYEYERHEENLN